MHVAAGRELGPGFQADGPAAGGGLSLGRAGSRKRNDGGKQNRPEHSSSLFHEAEDAAPGARIEASLQSHALDEPV
ncbi:hypothetical protein D3C87_2046790 [compost metagenome]